MSTKVTRIIVASIALFSLAGMAAPAEAAPAQPQARNVWCC
ncbi:hypothetical protein [Nocardioides sp.]|nr:hypothetical protein [Nocardioides sp.]MCW2738579.1 hypothetical protein [Nocardioides sp.]